MKTILLAMALCTIGFGASAETIVKVAHEGPNATMRITCSSADVIEQSLKGRNFTKKVMGRGVRGVIYEVWTGDMDGRSHWLLFFYDDAKDMRCQISAGIVGEKVVPLPKTEPEKPAPTLKEFKKKRGSDA